MIKVYYVIFGIRYRVEYKMKTISIGNKTAEELRSHLLKELALFEAVDNRFKRKYEMSLSELEEKIRAKGVPLEKHELWEDSIEWRNAVEEAEKLKAMVAELSTK